MKTILSKTLAATTKSLAGASAAVLCASVIAGTTTLIVAPQSAEAYPGVRMCYFDDGGTTKYFARDIFSAIGASPPNCSGGRPGGKDMPTLLRGGEMVDLSICENFTEWTLERGGDACSNAVQWNYNADYSYDYTKEELQQRCGSTTC